MPQRHLYPIRNIVVSCRVRCFDVLRNHKNRGVLIIPHHVSQDIPLEPAHHFPGLKQTHRAFNPLRSLLTDDRCIKLVRCSERIAPVMAEGKNGPVQVCAQVQHPRQRRTNKKARLNLFKRTRNRTLRGSTTGDLLRLLLPHEPLDQI